MGPSTLPTLGVAELNIRWREARESKSALVPAKKINNLSGTPEDFPKLAGKRVRMTGESTGDTINVRSIAVAAD